MKLLALNYTNNKIIIIIGLLLVFSVGVFSEKDSYFFHEKEKFYNPAHENTPNKYALLINRKPIDVIDIEKKEALYKTLKFDAYLIDNDVYRELILIKKVIE